VPSSGRALRIGLVCPYSLESPGGVQGHVLGLARHLVQEGHDAYVLAPGEPPPELHPALDAGRFSTAGAAVPLRYNGSVARVNFGPVSAVRVHRWLRRHQFDLLHIHEPVTPSVALLALWAAEQPVVATFHTATPRSRSMRVAAGLLRSLTQKLHASIAVSETARRVVLQHLRRDPLVIPNGIRFADFARTNRPASGTDRRLVFLGRTAEPRKGLDVLLAALPAIHRAVPGLEVIIAGEGAKPLPLGCAQLGLVSEAEKAELLRSADVFVAPHRARESFGVVVLEAMASGVPVVAADLEPFMDLLGPAVPGGPAAGTLFPSGDPQALARSVIEVLQRPDPVSTALARQRARRYDWSTVGAAVQRVYRTALAGARQAPLAASRPIMLTALPPPTGNLYAQPASMSSIAARTAPPAPSAQRAGKT
jgi:phosphatidylinositol alpha-mannosyltransferase